MRYLKRKLVVACGKIHHHHHHHLIILLRQGGGDKVRIVLFVEVSLCCWRGCSLALCLNRYKQSLCGSGRSHRRGEILDDLFFGRRTRNNRQKQEKKVNKVKRSPVDCWSRRRTRGRYICRCIARSKNLALLFV